ncbi:MAG: EAL domain-containing protein [Pseudomonadota bacterium]|nr:EAL domain-containing protein [Pseudomonadota bacterium]
MATNLAPKLKISSVLTTVLFSILLVSAATLWPIYEQHKAASLQKFSTEANSQSNLLKTLLAPVFKSNNPRTQKTSFQNALKDLQLLWKNRADTQQNTRYFLIEKNPKSKETSVILDIGQDNIYTDQEQLKPLIEKSVNETSLVNISPNFYLSFSSIYSDRFGLLILQRQPDLTQTIQGIAPYTGASILTAFILSWLILHLWKGRTLKKIGQSQARYKQLVESSMDWIWETDQHGNLTYSSEQCFNILGYNPQDIIGKPLFHFLLPSKAAQYEQNILGYMQHNADIYNLEVHFESKSGVPVMVLMNGQAYKNDANKVMGYRGINRDITQQKQRQDSIISMAYFDSLTQLPNRAQLIVQLNKHLAEVVQRKDLSLSALLFLDLDGFKDVNDSQGHDIGDTLLKEIAQRMQKISREQDQVFRLAGDEFVVLIRCKNKILMPEFKLLLHKYIEQLQASINQPLVIDSHNIIVSASVGVALIPQDGRTTSEILSHADSAMYQAKRDGKNCYRYFDSSMQEIEDRRKQMAREIKDAIKNKEFKLYYQLQIDSNSNKIYGMEALIRWPHPTRNAMISPAEFIEIAVEANHIQAIDKWVIEQATKDIAAMQKNTHRSIPVSINLSSKTLENPQLPQMINNAMEQNFLAPRDLRIEVTETSLLNNLEKAIESLESLRKKGIQTSIDDFGTGYSSLSYLQTLPIDTLKIDKSFIDKITTSNSDLQICRSIIQLAQSLNKNLIAEGVQSDIQRDILAEEGCFIIQGFLYAQPEPMSKIIQHLMQRPKQVAGQVIDKTTTESELKLIAQND